MTHSDEPDQMAGNGPAELPRLPRFGAGATGLLSLSLVAAIFVVPVFGLLIAPLGLIPVLRYQSDGSPGVRAWGWVLAALGAGAVLGLGPLALLLLAGYTLVVVIPAVSVQLWAAAGWSEGRWAALAVGAATVVVLAGVVVATAPSGPVDGVAAALLEAESEAKEMYGSMGFGQAEIELAFDASARVLPWVLPGFFVTYVVLILFWIRPRIPLLGYKIEVSAFEAYNGEEWLAAGFALAGLGALFLTGTGRWVALNLLIAVLLLYFVQGLAMIRAHLARWLGRGWFVRWGVGLLCVMWPMPILVTTLGVADSFYPLRPVASDDGGNE